MHFAETKWLIFILLIVFIRGYKIIPPRPPANAPQQIHIGFGQKVTDIIVLWATINNDTTIVEYHVGNNQAIQVVIKKLVKLHKIQIKNHKFKFLLVKHLIPCNLLELYIKDGRECNSQTSFFFIPKLTGGCS